VDDGIYTGTLKACITYQDDAARAYRFTCLTEMLSSADVIAWQVDAAWNAEQARIRLDRLNGHA
jgi:riboflavin synthase alpha subunit